MQRTILPCYKTLAASGTSSNHPLLTAERVFIWCAPLSASWCQGCCQFAAAKQQHVPSTRNILLLVQGDVPPGEIAGTAVA
jgi:hypothetical protein